MTLSELQSERDALVKTMAKGRLQVSIEGRTVTYGTADDMLKRLAWINGEIARLDGGATASYATFKRG